MKNLFITENTTIKETLKKLDETAEKVLIVVDDSEHFLGVITDGDIRRAILNGRNLNEIIINVYNKNSIFYNKAGLDYQDIKKVFIEKKIELVPIVDNKMHVIDFITWEKILSNGEDVFIQETNIDVPVVVMAGGKGSRLAPFTNILPKPLIPIGEKPVIEIIMDNFFKIGASEFYITLNYKGEMVKAYFNDGQNKYKIQFVFENNYLGTAGSLRLLPNNISKTFIITNCDIIVNADYSDVIRYHKENKNILTLLGSIQHYVIPYGVIKYREKGVVEKIVEKPEYDLTINTGIYIADKNIIKFIPENTFFHITDLINVLIEHDQKVGLYPVTEKSYIDIGQWEEYHKNIKNLKINEST